jgi:hypothetical protein
MENSCGTLPHTSSKTPAAVRTNFALTVFFHRTISASTLKWFTKKLVDVTSFILACGTGFIDDGLDVNVCKNTILVNILLSCSSLLAADSFG